MSGCIYVASGVKVGTDVIFFISLIDNFLSVECYNKNTDYGIKGVTTSNGSVLDVFYEYFKQLFGKKKIK